MPRELPTGTVTFLFTDIEGSTRLLHHLGPDEYADALAEHRRIVRDVLAAHGGVEVDTQGDAFFVAFPTAEGAAAGARAALEALSNGPIRVRMGLHTGAPTRTADGYVGLDVHRGARIAALAHGDQLLVSPSTAALLEAQPLHDLGEHRLKDFDAPVRLYQLGKGEFPPLRTPGSVDLPTPATRFLGREEELFDAVSLIYDDDPRLLTIVGPGGIGKTRFALELARLLAEDADGGTVFVPLSSLQDAALVVPTIANRLGAFSADVGAIAARVADRRTHVACDNLEHLLPAAAGPLAELMLAVPSLRLVATSREPLRIQGELQFDLPPLDAGDAVALFCERARAVRADITPSEAVTKLCDRLDRLPLALELAAARTKLLSPEQLLARIGDRLDGLKGTRDAEQRHATLRATISWSYDLLDAGERSLFAKLGVFRGGCTLETAEAVCEAELDTLASLLDKSLLRRREGRLGEVRYWMLESIRVFALEQLVAAGELQALQRRHGGRMLEIAHATRLGEGDTEADVAAGLAELDDLRAALDWAADADPVLGLKIAIELQNLWNASGPDEGMRRLEQLLDRAGVVPPDLRASALRVYGGTLALTGHEERSERSLQDSLRLYQDVGDERGIAAVEHMLAVGAWQRLDWERVRELTIHSQELARGRYKFIETSNYWLLGQLALAEGDVERATDLTLQGAEMASATGWLWWESGQRHELLMLALRRSDLADAERHGATALRIEREQDNRLWGLYTLTGLAQLALARGDLRRAGLLWGAAEREGEHLQRWADERVTRGGALVTEVRAAFVDACRAGAELELWDAAEIALATVHAATEFETKWEAPPERGFL